MGVVLFFPILPPIKIPLFFFNLDTAASTPSLLNPILLIIASSFIKRNILFFGFPSCGNGVNVPISIKPKPKFVNSLYNLASLSKPAANPTGFVKFNPKTFLSRRLSFKTKKCFKNLSTPGIKLEYFIRLKTK